MSVQPAHPVAVAWIVAAEETADAAVDALRVFGLAPLERLERALARHGVAQVHILAAGEAVSGAAGEAGDALLLRSDYLYDERLVSALAMNAATGTLLESADGHAVAARVPAAEAGGALEQLRRAEYRRDAVHLSGMHACSADRLVPAYDPRLRKAAVPFLLPARPEHLRQAERRIFAAAYKGITDFVTKWVWPLPARAVTRFCARRGITPNAVTALSYVLAILTALCFALGEFGLGLASGWLMTFLDTVDGKLARVTLTSTRLGDVLDHGLDLVHPPIWWAAWAWGLAGGNPVFGDYALSMWIVVGGYVVGRLLEGVFMLAFKQEMFTWRPFDAAFRLVIARRNPNLVMLSAGLAYGRPDLGFGAVAAWTLGSIAIQIVRIAQAAALRRAGRPIQPWHEERAFEARSASPV